LAGISATAAIGAGADHRAETTSRGKGSLTSSSIIFKVFSLETPMHKHSKLALIVLAKLLHQGFFLHEASSVHDVPLNKAHYDPP
jgi:hypothetical protein